MNGTHRFACGVWLALGLVMVGVMAGCSQKAAERPRPAAVPVMVTKAEEKSMPLEIRAIGTGEAYSSVSIKSQVSAKLEEVHFREGQFVKKGDLLFTLDRRPFEAALQQAEGNLAKDRAQAKNASVELKRYAELYQGGIVAKEQYDQYSANSDALAASVRADEAMVESAKLQLQYTTIHSPIDGVTGSLLVHAGNLVKENDVPILIVINQIAPIYVDFSLPEQYLAEVKKYMAAGKLAVEAYLTNDPQRLETGYLSFVDNAVDNTTGTIKFKGTFANTDRRLWPGEFVNVVLRLAEQTNAIVVPSQAVQTGQEGDFVFVVKPDMTVESRAVVIARTLGSQAVVSKGLAAGETVVTDGQVRLIPGTRIEVKGSLGGNQGAS